MPTNESYVPNLPDMKVVRVVKVNDTVLPVARRYGISVADYEEIVLHVVLKNSATAATITAYAWSPEANTFLPYDSAVTKSVAGSARIKFLLDRAHTVFLMVTGIAGGVPTKDRVFLEVGGIPINQTVG
jgi:hypothetical protein